MWELIVRYSVMSGGLLPLMAFLLLITIAVIIERWYFYHKVLLAGEAMEHDVQLVKYQNADDMKKVADHYQGTVQSAIISTALASRGENADAMERHIEESIMWQLPKMDKHMWVLDTAVTLAPLLGLFGTIIGMIKTFNVLGVQGANGAPEMVTGGIGEALIATGAGLLIAIIAIVFLNYFNKRVRLALHQMELLKVMVVNRLYGGGSAHHGVATSDRTSRVLPPVTVARQSP